jgi:hypothetical protein
LTQIAVALWVFVRDPDMVDTVSAPFKQATRYSPMSNKRVNKMAETRKIVETELKKVRGKVQNLDRQKILKSLQSRKALQMTPAQSSTYYHKALKEVA